MRDELCLREMVRARVRACARGDAAFAPFPYRAWLLRVAVHNPASQGKHACGRVCVRACGRVCVLLLALEGLRRARAVLRASTPPGKKTSPIVSTGAQYRAPTSRKGTAMKLGPGPKGV